MLATRLSLPRRVRARATRSPADGQTSDAGRANPGLDRVRVRATVWFVWLIWVYFFIYMDPIKGKSTLSAGLSLGPD